MSISKYCQDQWRLEKSGDSPTHHIPLAPLSSQPSMYNHGVRMYQYGKTYIAWAGISTSRQQSGDGEGDRAVPWMPPSLSTPLFIPGLVVTPARKRAPTTTVQYNCTQTPRGPGRLLQPALALETQYWVYACSAVPVVVSNSTVYPCLAPE